MHSEVRVILEQILTEKGVYLWMWHSNNILGGRTPISALEDGDFDLVKEAAMCFIDSERPWPSV